MNPENSSEAKLYAQIGELLTRARRRVVRRVNETMVVTYYEIGRIIVEHEQRNAERAAYGRGPLKNLSKRLAKDFERGFSKTNLENARLFYLAYAKPQTVSGKFQLPDFQLIRPRRLNEDNEQLSAGKYQIVLPSKEALKQLLERKTP